MAKISRRAYLMGMGVTAGAIASAPGELFAQHNQAAMELKSDSNSESILERPSVQRVRKTDLRSVDCVKLVFHGSMAFWQDSPGKCTIGFHSKPNGKHGHQLNIKAFMKRSMCEPLPKMFTNVAASAQITLQVSLPDIIDGVQFFQPPMTSDTYHDNDFRWLPNLEGPDWYGDVDRKPNVYKPELVVPNGLFYTLHKTASTFRRQTDDGDADSGLEIGFVADYVGANIFLKPGGYVKLTVQGDELTLQQQAGVSYEIHFDNECKSIINPSLACRFRPYHSDKTERNDFYMHAEGIDLQGKPEYQLVLAHRGKPTTPAICGEHRFSDEAPCSGVGFGGPGGFPSFPPL